MKTPTLTTTTFPPAYTVRRSARAKRTFLQISPQTGLEIVIPERLKRFNIEKILNDKRLWIEKMLGKIQKVFHPTVLITEKPPVQKPNDFLLCALDEPWSVEYVSTNTQQFRLTPKTLLNGEKILIIKGPIHQTEKCIQKLKKWLVHYAYSRLIPWLEQLSIETQLFYKRAIIRQQSTLWGSCNSQKTISLNYKLLFLDPLLTRHVLLHELCHLNYLNHSEKFWSLLGRFDEKVNLHRKILKKADHTLPDWLR